MKKSLLALATMGCFGLVAQHQAIPNSSITHESVKVKKQYFTGEEELNFIPLKRKKSAAASVAALDTAGNSYYDLQSNASIDDRIYYDPTTGEVTATWTMSLAPGPAFSDRGTGYNHYDGTQWGNLPSSRVENLRTGWPSLAVTDTSECIISHSADDIVASVREKGTSSWTSVNVSTNTIGAIWPRAAAGGPNNKTVHAIGITTPVINGGAIFKGLNGALMYYRSLDGGFTWDIQDSILLGQDSTLHSGFSGDSYAIDAKGNTVAIAVFNDYEDSFLLKSTDNGDTWTKTIFLDQPLDDYSPADAGSISDINNDMIADTIKSTDNTGSVLVDNNGLVHIMYGSMWYMDDDPVLDAASSFFPTTSGLEYWNENSTAPVTVTSVLDLDNDGVLAGGGSINSKVALYYISLTGQPSLGIDANNNIFCSYTMFNETEFNGSQCYRSIYMISSRDGGASWNEPKAMTPHRAYYECVFPSLARTVDDNLRLIYMEDSEPGLAVRGDEDPYGQNDILYLETDTAVTQFFTVSETTLEQGKVSSIYPNPTANQAWMNYSVNLTGEYSIEITSITGVVVKSIDLGSLKSGNYTQSLSTDNLSNGVYVVTLRGSNYASSQRMVIQK